MSLLYYDGTNTNSVIWTFLLLALDLGSGVIYPDILSLFFFISKKSLGRRFLGRTQDLRRTNLSLSVLCFIFKFLL